MKKFLFFVLFILFSFSSFSQITFDKGYITHQSGKTSEVFIRLDEMAGTPTKISYKISPNGEIKTADISTIKAFGIGETHRYIRHTVNIDRSPEDIKDLSRKRSAEFQEEVLFLRTLLSGENSLLYYKDKEQERFFIKKPDGEVEQLIYKKYSPEGKIIRTNNRFRQQLSDLLICEDISENILMKLNYNRANLMNIFQKYYECRGSEFQIHYATRKGELNLMVKAGVNFTNFGMKQDVYNIVEDFQYEIDPRIGLEIEYIFPMVNQKIAVYMEPSFSMYDAEKEIIIATSEAIPSNPNASGGYRALVNMKYHILDLPLGLRYYLYLDKANHSKMFVNAGASINLLFNSSEIIKSPGNERSDFDFNQTWLPTFFGGIGYRYNEKISVEVRYFPVRPLTDNGGYKLHQNHSFALVAGYTLF